MSRWTSLWANFVGTRIERTRPHGVFAGKFFVLGGYGDRFMHDRIERARTFGAEPKSRNRGRAIAKRVHLLPGQYEPDGSLQRARCQDGQHRLILRAQSRTEGAPHKRRDD